METILGILVGAGIKLILGFINDARGAAALKEAGAATTANTVNKETADAERRAAAVKPLDRDSAADRLKSGSF